MRLCQDEDAEFQNYEILIKCSCLISKLRGSNNSLIDHVTCALVAVVNYFNAKCTSTQMQLPNMANSALKYLDAVEWGTELANRKETLSMGLPSWVIPVCGGIKRYSGATSNAFVNGDTNTCSNCCVTEGPAELVEKVVD